VRRFLRGQPIFLPDRSHVHHRLLALGLTHRSAVLFLYSAGLIASILSLSLLWAHDHGEALILLAFISVALVGIEKLSYPELNAARKILFRGGLRREINAQLEVQDLRDGLRAARTAEDCWAAVQRHSSEFGFEIVRMRLGGRMFGEIDPDVATSTIRIVISEWDWAEVLIDANPGKHPNVLIPFVTTLRQVLANKEIEFAEQPDVAAFATVFSEIVSPTIQ
jgi:hypothetical protein